MNNKKGFLDIDWSLLIPIALLNLISLVTLFGINFDYFKSQFIIFVLSIFIFLLFSQANTAALKFLARPIYFISLALLTIVIILGVESRGSVRWVEFLGFRLQFSEVLKPFLAISLASFLTNLKKHDLRSFFEVFILLAPVFILIFLQPDLGNALIFLGVVLLSVIYVGFPFKYFWTILIPMFLASPILWSLLHDYQKQRVLTFFNPNRDPLGTSYNIIQSVIAVGSGMIMGKGFGQGTQSGLRFLPERHTDFIFATISEQLGLIGSSIILFCFIILLYKILKIYMDSNDSFSKHFSVIVFIVFLVQIFINIGMNIGILPIVGVTLPFVSYGGSSLLSNFIFIGLLVSFKKSQKSNDVLEIR